MLLYTKPRVYVEDITVKTWISGNTGIIEYTVRAGGTSENETASCSVVLRRSNDDRPVVEEKYKDFAGIVRIPDAKLWWPRGMHPEPGHLYTLEVNISGILLILFISGCGVVNLTSLPFRSPCWDGTRRNTMFTGCPSA